MSEDRAYNPSPAFPSGLKISKGIKGLRIQTVTRVGIGMRVDKVPYARQLNFFFCYSLLKFSLFLSLSLKFMPRTHFITCSYYIICTRSLHHFASGGDA
jgi:hypothetical protein